jgi:hypothetical protein
VAIAALEVIQEENLAENAEKMGAIFRGHLNAIDSERACLPPPFVNCMLFGGWGFVACRRHFFLFVLAALLTHQLVSSVGN